MFNFMYFIEFMILHKSILYHVIYCHFISLDNMYINILQNL